MANAYKNRANEFDRKSELEPNYENLEEQRHIK